MDVIEPTIIVKNLTMAYDGFLVLQDLDFSINKGDIFIVMGESGSGKSTLMRHLIGLQRPTRGEIFYGGVNFWEAGNVERERIMRSFGVLYQSGALWSSLTIAENVALPLQLLTNLRPRLIQEIVSLKLALVGLAGFERYYPAEISGGMKKRAALARAMALDPEILFFDEPSAGLDPITAHLLDDLILELRESLGTTIVIVTHELQSIFEIGNNSIFLDADTKTMVATGNPREILSETSNSKVISFLTHGEGTIKECMDCAERKKHMHPGERI